jgi:hypothetical protein
MLGCVATAGGGRLAWRQGRRKYRAAQSPSSDYANGVGYRRDEARPQSTCAPHRAPPLLGLTDPSAVREQLQLIGNRRAAGHSSELGASRISKGPSQCLPPCPAATARRSATTPQQWATTYTIDIVDVRRYIQRNTCPDFSELATHNSELSPAPAYLCGQVWYICALNRLGIYMHVYVTSMLSCVSPRANAKYYHVPPRVT